MDDKGVIVNGRKAGLICVDHICGEKVDDSQVVCTVEYMIDAENVKRNKSRWLTGGWKDDHGKALFTMIPIDNINRLTLYGLYGRNDISKKEVEKMK